MLTPNGTVVDYVEVATATDTIMWEISVAGDHNFAVSTGSTNLLVHDAPCFVGDDPDGGRVLHDADGMSHYLDDEGNYDDDVRLDDNGNVAIVGGSPVLVRGKSVWA